MHRARSCRSGVIHKRSYTEEEANLVLSTVLEIILESVSTTKQPRCAASMMPCVTTATCMTGHVDRDDWPAMLSPIRSSILRA